MSEKKIVIVIKPKLKIYQDSKEEWRWEIKMQSKIVGASTEGYKNKKDCISNMINLGKRIEQLKDHEDVIQ